MVKKTLVVILVLVIALGGWLLYYFSDKVVIKRQLSGLAVELGKEGQEAPIRMALKMHNIQNGLAKSCLVTIPERGYSEALEQDLIIRYLIYDRNRYVLLSVILADVIVDIPTKGQAVVQSTVLIRRQSSAQKEPVEESYQVELALIKSDKKWLLHKITMPEALVE